MDLGQRGNGRFHGHVAAEHRAAEAFSRDFDLFGQRNFLGSGQKRDLGHLAEIHAYRIAAEFGLFAGQGQNFGRGGGKILLDCRTAGNRAFLLIRGIVKRGLRPLVHQIDALFFQGYQQIIKAFGIDFFVGQIVVHLVVSQVALCFSLGYKFL